MWAYSFFRMGGDCVFVLAWLRVVFYVLRRKTSGFSRGI